MKRKFFSCLMFSALIGAGMISVTSCADYDEDMKALTQIVDQNTTVTTALQSKVDGMQAQIKALQDALAGMKSCTCGDVDAKIADQIAKALAGKNYTTPEQVADAINKALAGLNTGLTEDEVQALIDKYHAAHPNCNCGDIETLIKKFLAENPGLSENDVNKLIEAYLAAHPQSSLTETDVKSIVETYINQLQHFTKEQIEAMINTAIAQALAGYVQTSDVYTKSQVEGLIADAVKNLKPGLSKEEVQALIDAALKNFNSGLSESEVNKLIEDALKNVKPGLTAEEVQALIDAAKCNCPALTKDDVTSIANSVIEKYMQEHPYTLTPTEVESICSSAIANSTVINNLKGSIETLQTTVAGLEESLQNLKDDVYTKSEVEALIKALIAQAIGGISIDDNKTISELINDAINNYHTLHPDCNCEYDAAAFQEIVNGLATKAELQAVKDLIPTAEDLSKYVTTAVLTQKIAELNTSIANADAKAQEALNKANANGIAIENLQTTVEELSDLYIALSDKLDATTHKAEQAYTRALSNYFEIQELYATIQDARSYAEALAANAAAEAIKDVKEYTDLKLGELDEAYKKADEALQDQIDEIVERLDKAIEDINALDERVTKVENVLTHLITNIELQGSQNPAFGYFALPVGISSNVLIAYYGNNDKGNFKFPNDDDAQLVYKEDGNLLTSEDIRRIGVTPETIWGGSIIGDEGNAGKLYLTVNPSSVDFSGTEFKLVNSLGEESPVTLGQLKPCTDKLTFGQNRATANNGFYEATATVEAANLDKAAFSVNDQLVSALKDVYKNKTNANFTDLAAGVYKQLSGVLDAYAVQAKYQDVNGADAYVTSKYGIAATAVKPLSFSTLYGKDLGKLPTITPLSERGIDINDYFDFDKYKFTYTPVEANAPEFRVEFHSIEIVNDGVHIGISIEGSSDVIDLGKTQIEVRNARGVLLGYVSKEDILNAVVPVLNIAAEDWSDQIKEELAGKIESAIEDMIGDFNTEMEKVVDTLNKDIADLQNQAQDLINNVTGKADKFINRYNDLAKLVNGKLSNVNALLQVALVVEGADGIHLASTSSVAPTVLSGEGAATLYLTSHTGEILAPSYKKFVAVTNVYRDGKNADTDPELMAALQAANAEAGVNEVISGDRLAAVFHPTLKGANYEIVYSSVDYHGNISQRKYYIYVK